jgi:putative ABC transport system permease protein
MRLADLALLMCPREFREGYRREFRYAPPSEALNLAWTGVALRSESLARDAAFALRSLLKSPLFTIVVVLTLALALSVNAAVFSIINTLLLKPLPFVQPDRLAFVCGNVERGWCAQMDNGEIGAVRKRATAFDGIAAFSNYSFTLTGFGVPQSLLTAEVSANFFDVLRVRPQLGRFFTAADARPGVRNIVISYDLWRNVFNGAARVVGRTIALDGESWRVIGVAPRSMVVPTPFGGKPEPMQYQLWGTLPQSSFGHLRSMHDWAFARLRARASEAQANAQVSRIAKELAQQYPVLEKGTAFRAQGFTSFYYSGVRPLLYTALAAVIAVLLIACANIANLLLVRAITRRAELAVRNALGAARRSILQQLVVEIGLLAASGGVVGLGLAWLELKGAAALNSASLIPDLDKAGIDFRVALFTFGVALIAALLAGVVPAVFTSRRAIALAMRSAGRNAPSARMSVRNSLGAVQIALAFAVVIASLLLYRSFVTITHADIGMDPHNVYVALVNMYAPRWNDPGARERFVRRAISRIRRIPAVDGVYATRPSFWGGMGPEMSEFHMPGRSYGAGTGPEVTVAQSTPGFLKALRVPLLRGRSIESRDTAVSQRVAVVENHFVQKFFPGKNVVGTTILLPEGAHGAFVPVQIVGVVGTITKFGTLEQPVIYIPNAQFPSRMPEFFIHLRKPDAQLRAHVAQAIAAVDPLQAVTNFYSEEATIDFWRSPQQTSAAFVGVLALIALLLALAGIYGITAYSVQQREHEIGVRMAIGATARAVVRNVLAGGLRIGAIGIAIGVVLSALAARGISGMLFQTSAFDPVMFGSAIAILLICVTVACTVPALRAATIDPAKALRYE